MTRKPGRLKRRSRIKPVSDKRRKRNAEAKPIRQALKEEIGRCELCEQPAALLDCHEITRGASRVRALTCRAAILVLCRGCHETIGREPTLWTVARQAALLRLRREADYCLVTLNGLLVRQVCEDEVELAGLILRKALAG